MTPPNPRTVRTHRGVSAGIAAVLAGTTLAVTAPAANATPGVDEPIPHATTGDTPYTHADLPTPTANPSLPDSCGFDATVVIDTSGSMSTTDINNAKSATKALADALTGSQSTIRLVPFATNSPSGGNSDVDMSRLNVDTQRNTLNTAIDNVSRTGLLGGDGTLYHRAFEQVLNDPGEVVLFITDGGHRTMDPNYDHTSSTHRNRINEWATVANQVKAGGARIIPVGIDNDKSFRTTKPADDNKSWTPPFWWMARGADGLSQLDRDYFVAENSSQLEQELLEAATEKCATYANYTAVPQGTTTVIPQTNDLVPDAATFELTQATPGFTIDPDTGDLSYTAGNPGDIGSASVRVTYANGRTLTRNVLTYVTSIVYDQVPDYTDVAGVQGDVLTSPQITPDMPEGTVYSFTGPVPEGMTIDAATGEITWNTTLTSPPGSQYIGVQATYTNGQVAETEVRFALEEFIDSNAGAYSPATGDQGTQVVAEQTGDLAEGTGAAITDDRGLTGVTINPETGDVTWDIPIDQAPGDYSVEVTITYPNDETQVIDVPFTVTEIDYGEAPTYGPGTAEQGQTVTADLVEDLPTGATAAITGGAQDGMTIDPATGQITWPTEITQTPGPYPVEVTITYPNGTTKVTTANLAITAIDYGADPAYAPVSGQQGTTLTSGVDAPLPAGATAAITGGEREGLTIDSTTGTLTWDTDITQPPGTFPVEVTFTYPNGTTAVTSADLSVTAINYGDLTYTGGSGDQGTVLTSNLTDPLPAGATAALTGDALPGMTIDPTTGEITWPTAVTETPASHAVTVEITYPNGTTTQTTATFTVTAINYGDAPVYDPASGVQGTTITADPVSMPAGATAAITSGGQAGMTIDPATGALTWATTVTQAPGDYPVEVTFTYPNGTTKVSTADLTVTAINYAALSYTPAIGDQDAVLVASPATALPEGSTASMTGGEPGMVINESTGVITWDTDITQAPGTFQVQVTVTYPNGTTATAPVDFIVNELSYGDAPVYVPASGDQGTTLTSPLEVELSGGATAAITSGSQPGMTIDAATGTITWDTEITQAAGDFPVTVTVSYPNGTSRVVSTTFTVQSLAYADLAYGPATGYQDTELSAELIEPLSPGATAAITGGVQDGMTIDSVTGTITWPVPITQEPGTYPVEVTATYPNGSIKTTTVDFVVAAIDYGGAPVYAPASGNQGTTITATTGATLATGTTAAITSGGQTGMSINAETGEISWATPITQAPGPYPVEVTFTYPNGTTAVSTVDLTVNALSYADPVYSPVTGVQGSTLVGELDGGALPPGSAAALVGEPVDGMTIDAATGAVTWVTGISQAPALYPVQVQVTYPNGSTKTATVDFTVTAIDYDAVDYTTVSGDQGAALVASTVTPLPTGATAAITGGMQEGMTINAETGEITWTTDITQTPGTFPVEVTVTYPNGTSAVGTATFLVNEVAYGDTVYSPATGNQGETLTSELGEALPTGATAAITAGALAGMGIDPVTGEITWSVPIDQAADDYPVEVTITYPNGTTRTVTSTFTVAQLVYGDLAYVPVSGEQGTSLVANMVDPLPEGATAAITAGGNADMSIDPITGAVTWDTPITTPAGDYVVDVLVTYPNGTTATVSTTLQVTAINYGDAPVYAPVIGNQGTALVGTPVDPIPAGATAAIIGGGNPDMTIDPATGTVTWNTAVTQAPGITPVTVEFTYTNGTKVTSEVSFEVTAIDYGTPTYGTISGPQGAALVADLSVDIPEGATIAFTDPASVPEGMTLDTATGDITWATLVTQEPGQTPVEVTISYPNGTTATATATFDVQAIDYGTAPAYDPATITQGQTQSLPPLGAVHPDALAAITGGAQTGMTINEDTGEITWAVPITHAPGDYPVEVTFSYPNGTSHVTTPTVTVAAINYADLAYGPSTGEQGQTITVDLVDPLDPDATAALTGDVPEGVVINPDTGQITWDTDITQAPGTYPVTVVVTYPNGTTKETTVDLVVTGIDYGAAPEYGVIIGDQGTTLVSTLAAPLPEGATAALVGGDLPVMMLDAATGDLTWSVPVTQAPGDYVVDVLVTYPNGTTRTVAADFTVNALVYADLAYTPVTQDQGTTLIADLIEPLPAGATTAITSGLQTGMAINPTTGEITWPVAVDHAPGTYPVEVTATYPNGTTKTTTVDFTVTQIVYTDLVYGPATADQGQTISTDLVDALPTGATAAITGDGGIGAVIDAMTGQVTWDVPITQTPGTYPVEVTVTYPNGTTATVTVDLVVEAIDYGAGQSYGEVTVVQGQTIVSEQTGDALPEGATVAITSGEQPGMVLDALTGDITWVTEITQAPDTYPVVVTTTYPNGTTSQTTATFVVSEIVLGDEIGYTAASGMQTETLISTQVGQGLPEGTTFALTGQPPAGMEIDPATGTITWVTDRDSATGDTTATVLVTYPNGRTVESEAVFTVTDYTYDVAFDYAPVSGEQADTLVSPLRGDNPAGTVWEIIDGAQPGMTINATTGEITWVTDTTMAVDTYEVTVRATFDNEQTQEVIAAFDLALINYTQDPDYTDPRGYQGTTLTAEQVTDLPEGTVAEITGGDMDGLSIDPATGDLAWDAKIVQAPGTYPVEVTFTFPNGQVKTTTVDFVLDEAVYDNSPLYNPVTGDQGTTLSSPQLNPDVPEGVTYTITGAAEGVWINPVTGEIIWNASIAVPAGTYEVTVTAIYPNGTTKSVPAVFTVVQADRGDTLRYGQQTIRPGDTARIDQLGDLPRDVTFELIGGTAEGATVDPVTGRIVWETGQDIEPGDYDVTVRVTYPDGTTEDATATVTVAKPSTGGSGSLGSIDGGAIGSIGGDGNGSGSLGSIGAGAAGSSGAGAGGAGSTGSLGVGSSSGSLVAGVGSLAIGGGIVWAIQHRHIIVPAHIAALLPQVVLDFLWIDREGKSTVFFE